MGFGASGTRWAIATPHGAATDAGARAFDAGGNAIDAALAAAVTLAVTYPQACGVGGDLFAVVERAGHDGGDTLAVNSSGRAARAVDPVALRAAHGDVMPERGPAPITVPGAVAGWQTLHDIGARLPWAAHFDAAIAAAIGGSPIPPTLGSWLTEPDGAALILADRGLSSVFAPGGVPLRTGESFRQPALGRTLEVVAAGGAETWYRGAAGQAYVEGLRAADSPLVVDDLADHEAAIVPALSASWRGLHVQVAPPNSPGYSLLQILSLAERLELEPDPAGPDAGWWARLFLAAEHDVRRHLGDPGRMSVHVSTLLDDGHLAAMTDEVRGVLEHGPGTSRPSGDTIALVAADRDGHAVSLIQSLFNGFGAGILEPSTGVIAHNRGACFTLEPERAGTLAPGAMPPHTLLPVTIHDDRGLVGVAGTMGGYQQPQIDAQTITSAFALGRSAADAVAGPRFVVDDLPLGDGTPPADVEPGVGAGATDAIAAQGFAVRRLDRHDSWVGHAQLIHITRSGFDAGSDPRADGSALAG